jgi:hypothetical protein
MQLDLIVLNYIGGCLQRESLQAWHLLFDDCSDHYANLHSISSVGYSERSHAKELVLV